MGCDIHFYVECRVGGVWQSADKWYTAVVDEFWTRFTTKLGCKQPVFSMDWSVHYYEVASDFLSETLPRLWRLGQPEDVRIVFWFDN